MATQILNYVTVKETEVKHIYAEETISYCIVG